MTADVSIIGAGRLGATLGHALSSKGFRIKALSCRRLSSAEESRKVIGQGKVYTDNIHAAENADVVIITLPDDKIREAALELASSDIVWQGKFVFHCSGLLCSGTLGPLKTKGAITASVHPIQSFSQKQQNPQIFEGIYFGLEGNRSALSRAKEIVRRIGGQYIVLKPDDKPLYHAACSFASNFFVLLLDMAVQLLEQVGLEKKSALSILLPLVQGTLNNAKNAPLSTSLSGPIIRGDQESVKNHIVALRKIPSFHEFYVEMASRAVEMAEREGKLSPEKLKSMRALLEGK